MNDLTEVKVIFLHEQVNHYTRFGHPVLKETITPHQGFEYYPPKALVGYIQWQGGDYGSRLWRFMIFMAVKHSHKSPLQVIEAVTPAVNLILDLEGATKVRAALKAIDHIESLGLDPADESPAFYGYLHQRITVNQPYHPYSIKQHDSYLKEKGIVTW